MHNQNRINGHTPLKLLKKILDHPDFSHLHDPFYFSRGELYIHSPLTLPDIEKAVGYLKDAIDKKSHIYLLGDRDVDGVSSTAMLGNFLRKYHVEKNGGRLSMKVSDDGDDYGLCGKILEEIEGSDVDLLILLDMGTSNGSEIENLIKANSNLRVIVIDHHLPNGKTPDELHCAFLNPMREDVSSHYQKKIATVGLVFKFLLAHTISFTSDWNTFYFCSSHSGSEQNENGHLFRLGVWQGSFDSRTQASEFIKTLENENFTIMEADPFQNNLFSLSKQEKEFIISNPVDGGKILFSRHISKKPRLKSFLENISELTAVGMIADMMPMTDENRSIVRLGLGLDLQTSQGREEFNPGYSALLRSLNISKEQIRSRDLGWSIAPVLNAAGRLGKTYLSLNLLTESSPGNSKFLSEEIINLNEQRKERTKINENLIEKHFLQFPEKLQYPFLFFYDKNLLAGVSGIVATRMSENYNRPAIIINPDGPFARGSLRSRKGENMLELISSASDLLNQFGGHKEAAGFSIAYENIEELEKRLQTTAPDILEKSGSEDSETKSYHIEISPEDLKSDLLREIDFLEPFGPENPEPTFLVSGAAVKEVQFLSEGKHLKFYLQEPKERIPFVFWREGEKYSGLKINSKIDIIGNMEWNFFRGRCTPQFRVTNITFKKQV